MKIPHPIQYQGSKRALAPRILAYLPDNSKRLVEPFAGTAAISVAAASSNKLISFWINDLNKPLAGLLDLIVNEPSEISDFYESLWNSQGTDPLGFYNQIRDDFNRTLDPKLFLFLLSRCVKGSVRYNSKGLFNQSPDKRRLGTHPKTMKTNIFGVSCLLKGRTLITSLDYRGVLKDVTEDDIVYMDPPYQGVCTERDTRYFSSIDHDDFIYELARLNERNISFLVSYDGKTGEKQFGKPLPESLSLSQIELEAGRSTQATLLKREYKTTESLYLSPAISKTKINYFEPQSLPLTLFETCPLENRGHNAG